MQLITKVQVASNNTDDSQLLAEALPNLKERTELETIYTDGGHGGPAADTVLQEQQVEHIQTAIRGRSPNPDKLHLADFTTKLDDDGRPVKVTCPQGQTLAVQTSSQQKALIAHFEPEVCQICPLTSKCPAQPGRRDRRYHLRFTQAEALAAERRRRSQQQQQEGRNLRAAIEATVRSLKHPFPAGKLPVRGRFRVACLLIGSAAVANIRRIQCYLEAQMKAETLENPAPGQGGNALEQAGIIFVSVKAALTACRNWLRPQNVSLSW